MTRCCGWGEAAPILVGTFRLLSKISYEAPKMLDLDSETLIYSKHGIFIIFISNFKEFGVFCHGTSVGAASPKVLLKI